MRLDHHTRPLARAAAGGALAVSALGLSACADDTAGPETGTDVEDIQEEPGALYDGFYDTEFYGDLESYESEMVTVSAKVNEVFSPTTFVIAGTEDTTVEPLLVVGAEEVNDLEPGQTVAVTGVVHQTFAVDAAEEELGVELDDGVLEDWGGYPFIAATSVDTTVPSED